MNITPFQFESQSVRVITDENGEPFFVAADVLTILTLDRKALERLDDDEKGVSSIHTPGGVQDMTTVNEPGLYSLVLGSKKPEAKRFKRWVTHEVLPTIRKTGRYDASAPVDLSNHTLRGNQKITVLTPIARAGYAFFAAVNPAAGYRSPSKEGAQPPEIRSRGFSTSARSIMARSMGGPCGRAQALPVPSFRSANPHGSAHPFRRGCAENTNRKEGVLS